jgi:hypothetical protein
MEDLYLVYINSLGVNWRGKNIYEFIFSDNTHEIDDSDCEWDTYPASSGDVKPPKPEVVKAVAVLETNLLFDVIAESDTFSVWDCVDGIVALAFENILEYEQYPSNRLVFHFGDPVNKVKDILYGRDITIEIKKTYNED